MAVLTVSFILFVDSLQTIVAVAALNIKSRTLADCQCAILRA